MGLAAAQSAVEEGPRRAPVVPRLTEGIPRAPPPGTLENGPAAPDRTSEVRSTPEALALPEAAAGLSRQLQDHLSAMAGRVRPHAPRLNREFARRLRGRGFTPAQRSSLMEITPAAAAVLLSGGQPLGAFLEEVEYRGRRLAKLGLTPARVLDALREFDSVFDAVSGRYAPREAANFAWVRDQLHFCAVLTLNNAFYQVREAESRAFYELYRAEAETSGLDSLMQRFQETLLSYTGAEEAKIVLFDAPPARALRKAACFDLKKAPAGALADPAWARRYACCWHVPMTEGGAVRGALQFAFARAYAWLPREQELLTAAAERCWRAVEKARLMADLAQREEQIRRLAEHMVEVEEAERRRISRELHDEAGQSLLCVRLQLEMAEQDLGRDPGGTRQRVTEARDLVDHSIVEIRRLIAALSPAVLEQMGLAAGLRQLVARFRSLHPGTEVALRLPRRLDLPRKSEIIVYRLVQECFNNISKYSSAAHVNLCVDLADGVLSLRIEDDGVGFDVEQALSRQDCYGLSGLRERVALLGGSLSVRSLRQGLSAEPGRVKGKSRTAEIGLTRPGTSIRIQLPAEAGSGDRPLPMKAVRRTAPAGSRRKG